jgi:hypothetical protein
VAFVAQFVLCRGCDSGGHPRNQFLSFGAGLASAAATLLFLLMRTDVGWLDLVGYFTWYLMTYAFLGFCVLNVINLNASSLRIRIIREIYGQQPLPAPDAVIMAKCLVSYLPDARLLRPESARLLQPISGRRYLRCGATDRIAHFFSRLQAALLADPP